ncbi:MAG TPA: regulatory protein RecX, partial [Ignavibacteriaceae bacterium]|nr:regulatory protein RecX [Ignavibacteriaceae bacterium]
KENQKYFIRKKAIDLIARRPHSAFELKIKLMNRKYDKDLIDSIIKDLTQKNILNDREFAIQYSAERTSLRKIGKQKIKSELIKKGIPNSIIEEVLENIDYADDYENAVKLAEKKYKSLHNRKIPPEKIKNKIISFLLSKGYDYEIAKQSVKKLELTKNLGDDFED